MCELMAEYPPPVPVTGRAGTVVILHCNLLHASGHNLSASDRRQAYLCYNQVANHPHEVGEPAPGLCPVPQLEPARSHAGRRESSPPRERAA